MAKIVFEGSVPVSHEDLLAQVAHAKSLGYPEVREQEPHGRRLAVVGGGPSIVDRLDEIREFSDIWAINGACGFLRERGIESTLLTLDPCDFLAPRVAGATKALLATRCHPDVFKALDGADITVFDAVNDTENGLWASCSSVTVAFHLATVLGYRQSVFFGCEGSFSERSHAYMDEQELQDFRFVVECDGRQYVTAPDLYMLTMQMAVFFRLAVNDSFTERSGGLLRALIANPEHEIVKVSRQLAASLKPIRESESRTLVEGFEAVYVGFRPACVRIDGQELAWSLISDLPSSPDNYGTPQQWATDGHRIYFDKRADRDYTVEVEKP